VTAATPASAWQCGRCGFNHFKFWRARHIGPSIGVGDAADIALRNEEAANLMETALQLVGKGQLKEAAEVLHRAIKLRPNDADLRDELALCYSRLGDHGRALEESNRAISLDPRVPKYFTNCGLRYLRRGKDGDIEQAEECAKKALEIHPNHASAQRLLGMVASARKRRSQTS
jgi:Flp pilus assembly protein TadD